MSSLDLFGNPTRSPNQIGRGDAYDQEYAPSLPDTGEVLEDEQLSRRPFHGMLLVLALSIGILATQAYRLQVLAAASNRARAEGNSVRLLSLASDRGLVLDSNGTVLAQNSRKLALAINPQALPHKLADREPVYQQLRERAGLGEADITAIEGLARKTPETFPIKTNLTKEESLLYREWFTDTPGVVIQEVPVRKYAELASLGQLLGYTGRPDQAALDAGIPANSLAGKGGIEQQYDQLLRGTSGVQRAEVNASGEVVRLLPDSANSDPRTGTTLKLSLDAKLQETVATALRNELDRRTKKFGPLPKLGASAVVLDPATGAVKALVSLPDYSTSLFANGISSTDYQALLDNPGNPLLNRVTQGSYAPGSTIKPLLATAGLQSGVIGPNTQLTTPEAIYIGSFRFPDWKTHGLTNTRQAIAESNNIFFYAVGGGWEEGGIRGLGIESLAAWYQTFGFGSPTGIDIPGETGGLVPTPAWKKSQLKQSWYIGDTYQASIGQGFLLATPLQLATATAAVVNGGTVWEPQLAWSTLDAVTGTETLLPHTASHQNIADPGYLQVVREGMRQTVLAGSARPLNKLTVTSAGKTGTAQVGSEGRLNAWYTGFAPYENPKYVFAILIEGGGESFYSSIPTAEEILRGMFDEPLPPGQQLTAQTQVPVEFTGER